jgi:hypothetical protein
VQSTYSYQKKALLMCHSRCTAPVNNLDSGWHVRCSQAHAELLVEEFELGMLWDEYGLVGDIVVRLWLSIVAGSLNFSFLAIHYLFPQSQYQRTFVTQPPTPANQRCLQGPSCHMGEQLHQSWTFSSGSTEDTQWYWSPVSLTLSLIWL